MNARVNSFADLSDPPIFTTKRKKERPVEEETITRIAEQNNFPSRQAPKPTKAERRKPRIYRTGRNQQFNAKATPETIARFYRMADEKPVPLGELLKQGLDALEAVASLQKLADKRNLPLVELVKLALEVLEREGATRGS
jgi:DNA mismatch repair ATPase MutS